MGRSASRGDDAGGQIKLRLIFAFLLLSVYASAATDYFVRTDGADTHAGTTNSAAGAWLTIAKCASTMVAGDTCHVQPGTYSQGSSSLTLTTSGTSANHIRYVSDTKWGAVITSTNFFMVLVNGDFIDFDNFEVSGQTGNSQGVDTNGSNDRIRGNHIHDIPVNIDSSCQNGGAGWDNTGFNPVEFSGNIVHDVGWGDPCYQGAGLPNEATHGIYAVGTGLRVFNNISFHNAGFGVNTYHNFTDVQIINNTIFNNGAGGIVMSTGGSSTTANNVIVRNNISVNNTRYSSTVDDGRGIELRGTSFWGTGTSVTNNLNFGNAQAGIRCDTCTPTGTVTANPAFVNYTGTFAGDYHLTSASPARDAGLSALAPSTDFDGVTRPQNGAFDIGAYEFLTTPPPVGPIAFVQSATTSVTSAAPALAYAANLGLSDSSFVTIGLTSGTATVTSVTDTQGLTYTKAIGPIVNSGETIYIYFANLTTAAADTVTVHLSASVAAHVNIAEYSSSGATFTLDKTASGTGTSSSAATSAVTTSVANELLLAYADTASGPSAGIAFVRQASNSGAAVNPLTVTITAPAAGDALVATVYSNTSPITSITGGGVTWARAVSEAFYNEGEIWYGTGSTGVGTTITINYAGSQNQANATISEWSGMAATPLDTTTTGHATASTAIATTAVAPSVNGDLVMAMGAYIPATGSLSAGPTNSYTALTQVGSAANGIRSSAYLLQGTAAATSTTWTWSVATNSDTAMASFKAAASSLPPTVGTGYVARQSGTTFMSEEDIVTSLLTAQGLVNYSASIPWAAALATFFTAPNVIAPPPPPPPPPPTQGVPNQPSPCP